MCKELAGNILRTDVDATKGPMFIRSLILAMLCMNFGLHGNAKGVQTESIALQSVEIVGTVRSDPHRIREILFNEGVHSGAGVTLDKIVAAVQRLKNLQLYSEVEWEVVDLDTLGQAQSSAGAKILKIRIEDRWTLIPIAKFSSGGGISQLIVGAYDANLLGRVLEVGAQYERLGSTNSGVAWFKNPRLFGSRVSLDLQVWNISRLRTKYQQDRLTEEVQYGFLQSREKFFLALNRELTPAFELGVTVEYNRDKFSDEYLADEVQVKTLVYGGVPVPTKFIFAGARARVGVVNYDNWRTHGWDAELTGRQGVSLEDSAKDFFTTDLRLRSYLQPVANHTLAWRGMLGMTSTESDQYWYDFGGLLDVRGFADGRFSGRSYWLSNLEYRVPIYVSSDLVLQQVSFYDAIGVAEQIEDLGAATGSSVGVGIRFVAPKIYRFVARLDYARAVVRRDTIPISFGVQQFF